MKKIYGLLIASFLLCTSAVKSQTIYPNYTDGEIYVKFKSGALKVLKGQNPNALNLSALSDIQSICNNFGVTKSIKPFYQADDDITLQHILKFYFTNPSQVNALITSLRNNPAVEYAEKVPLMQTCLTPNDAQFASQWHLTKINATTAWNVFSGNSNITVAVVDNAVSIVHQDLSPVLWVNTGEIAGNSIDDDGNGYIDDVNGWDAADNDNNPNPPTNAMDHGTHCAGIAAAATNNNIGVASIGFGVRLIGVKCQINTGSNTGIANGYGGIIYAAKVRARVISCSWGGAGSAAAEQAVIDYAWNRGCIVIAAAGNNNVSTMFYPAAYNNVYSVANTGTTDAKAGTSNYGTWIDISAPGQNILSTLPGNNYGNNSGTSMACPLVAGLAGLMLGHNALMTQTAVLNCISSTATNIASANSPTLAGLLGAGRIDAFAAMNCANAALSTPPVANFFTLNRFPCPGTSVQFQDSSLYKYSPTTYNWTFQGGTPATSTSSAPVVSWAAPGTYSVSLQITTPNGSNTKIKTSYITVAGPIALPLVEGFQTTPFLPANWTPLNIDNDNIYWARNTTVGGFGASTASAMFDNYNLDAAGTRDEMRAPKYNFAAVANASLTFDVAYAHYSNTYSDTLEVRLSTNCGTSWNSIYLKGGVTLSTAPTNTTSLFVPTATQWRKEGINLTPYAGQGNVMISFVNRGHYGQAIYVDNVNISFTNTAAPVASYTVPSSGCVGSTITYTNTSTSATSYNWTFQGGSPASSTLTNPAVVYSVAGVYSTTLIATNVSGTNAVVGTITISAAPTLTLNVSPTPICAGQTSTISVSGTTSSYTLLPGGITTAPFVVTPTASTIYTVNASGACGAITRTTAIVVNPSPTVTVNTATICAGANANLTASGAISYSWSTGATINPLVVSPAVTTVYTVTGTTGGCTNTKTTTVTVIPNPTVSVNSVTICPGGAASITASGANTYSWSTGATTNPLVVSPAVTTVYTVTGTTGGCTNTKTVSVTIGSAININLSPSSNTVCSGSAATITATGATAYTMMPGSLTSNPFVVSPTALTIYTVTGTSGACSGSQIITIAVNPNPTVTVNSTTVCFGTPATLTASGATTYSWSTGANTNPLVTTQALTTVYTVTGTTGACASVKTATVSVNPTPFISVSFTNASCASCPNGSAAVVLNSPGTSPYNFTWSNGATTPTLGNLLPACYTVTITDANNCKDTTNTCIGFANGLTKLSLEDVLRVYPNPAHEQLFVKNGLGMNYTLEIYDAVGKRITRFNSTAIEISVPLAEYAKGIYVVKLMSEDKQQIFKLVID
jgi:serine protease